MFVGVIRVHWLITKLNNSTFEQTICCILVANTVCCWLLKTDAGYCLILVHASFTNFISHTYQLSQSLHLVWIWGEATVVVVYDLPVLMVPFINKCGSIRIDNIQTIRFSYSAVVVVTAVAGSGWYSHLLLDVIVWRSVSCLLSNLCWWMSCD